MKTRKELGYLVDAYGRAVSVAYNASPTRVDAKEAQAKHAREELDKALDSLWEAINGRKKRTHAYPLFDRLGPSADDER